jgi:hypothetical protein
MHKTPLLAFLAVLVSHAAAADVKRHEFIPASLRGTWAPSAQVCENADKAAIVVSAKTYVSAAADCMVMWVSETAAARGPMYSAHLQCSTAVGKTGKKTASNVMILPAEDNQISVGPAFSSLKVYHRCSALEPDAPQ